MAEAPIPVHQQFSEEQKNRTIELYNIGKTQEEIANEFGVSRRTIMKLCIFLRLHKNHSDSQKSKFDPIFVEQVKKLRLEGNVITEIARLTGRSISAVCRVCEKKNIIKPGIQWGDLKTEYECGLSIADLAAKYRTSEWMVSKKMSELGVKRRPPILIYHGKSQIKVMPELPPYEDTIDWYKHVYVDLRCSLTQIQTIINKSIGFISGRLKKYNIPLRSISEGVRRLDPQVIIESYKKLGSMSKVADSFNCTVVAISNILESNGITPTSTSEMFIGEGNPFFGKQHPEEIKKQCIEIGAYFGQKFWDDHPDYINIVKEKQKEIWSDLELRRKDSEMVARLRLEGKLQPKKGIIQTRWGPMNFDSSWEMDLIEQCEKDNRIVLLERDFALIEYEYNGLRNFVPDFRIWLRNGEFIVVEIKNNWLAKQEKERAKISAAFNIYMDKFMVVDNLGIQSVFDRISLLLSPQDFEFENIILTSVKPDDYIRFYGLFHYLGQTGRQGPTLGAYILNKLIAVATMSSISRNEIAERLEKTPSEVRELVRFCIHPDFHKKNFASWFLTRVVNQYIKDNPNIKVLVSFADTSQGHSGTIYKAAGWREDGETGTSYHYVDREGFIVHKKTAYDRGRSQGVSESIYVERSGLMKVFESPKKRFILEVGKNV